MLSINFISNWNNWNTRTQYTHNINLSYLGTCGISGLFLNKEENFDPLWPTGSWSWLTFAVNLTPVCTGLFDSAVGLGALRPFFCRLIRFNYNIKYIATRLSTVIAPTLLCSGLSKAVSKADDQLQMLLPDETKASFYNQCNGTMDYG